MIVGRSGEIGRFAAFITNFFYVILNNCLEHIDYAISCMFVKSLAIRSLVPSFLLSYSCYEI